MEYTFINSGIEEHVFFSEKTVKEVFLPLLQCLTRMQRKKSGRVIVFLAAPPGAGKSTLASFLGSLSQSNPSLTPVTVIGMDGFHHYQQYLDTHTTIREGTTIPMSRVKGAPETFDLPLLTERLRRISAGEDCGWPVYDRLLHNPVEDAITVSGDIVLLEGNYLLLDLDGWQELRMLADYTVFLTAEESFLRGRLIRRKISTGVTENDAAAFVDYSDMRNVRTCLQKSSTADLVLAVQKDGILMPLQ